MNVLFSFGDRSGNTIVINRLLQYLNNIDVNIASYIKYKDWIDLSLLKENPSSPKKIIDLFGYSGLPRINYFATKGLIDYVCDLNPDVIICDGEPILANIAKLLGIELWYCSPLHILDGAIIGKYDLKYHSKLLNTRKFLSQLPEPNRIFIYSYFGDMDSSVQLKNGYNWISPYHLSVKKNIDKNYIYGIGISSSVNEQGNAISKIIENIEYYALLENFISSDIDDENYSNKLEKSYYSIISGNTSIAADCIYNNIYSYIIPSINNPESLINASLLESYNIGFDLYDLSRLRKVDVLDKIKNSISYKNQNMQNIKVNNKYLHNYLN